jgi:hypothetical protein
MNRGGTGFSLSDGSRKRSEPRPLARPEDQETAPHDRLKPVAPQATNRGGTGFSLSERSRKRSERGPSRDSKIRKLHLTTG